jgi:hypothetical protein
LGGVALPTRLSCRQDSQPGRFRNTRSDGKRKQSACPHQKHGKGANDVHRLGVFASDDEYQSRRVQTAGEHTFDLKGSV